MAGWVYKPLPATCPCGLSLMHMQQGPSASLRFEMGARRQLFIMRSFFLLFLFLLLVSHGSSAVITGACEKDTQCGGGMCCAVSLWIRSLRMCTPMGQEGDDCHPMSHKVPFLGKRIHHTCPCMPNLSCITIEEGKSKCLSPPKNPDYYL